MNNPRQKNDEVSFAVFGYLHFDVSQQRTIKLYPIPATSWPFKTSEAKHFQPRQMGLAGHSLGRSFIHQPLVFAAHEGLMVEIKLQESEDFLADDFEGCAQHQTRLNGNVAIPCLTEWPYTDRKS